MAFNKESVRMSNAFLSKKKMTILAFIFVSLTNMKFKFKFSLYFSFTLTQKMERFFLYIIIFHSSEMFIKIE